MKVTEIICIWIIDITNDIKKSNITKFRMK